MFDFDFAIIGGGVSAIIALDTICNTLLEDKKRRKTIKIAIIDERDSIGGNWHDVHDEKLSQDSFVWLSSKFQTLNFNNGAKDLTKKEIINKCQSVIASWKKVPGVTIEYLGGYQSGVMYKEDKNSVVVIDLATQKALPHSFAFVVDTLECEENKLVTDQYVKKNFANATNTEKTHHVALPELKKALAICLTENPYEQVVVVGNGNFAIDALKIVHDSKAFLKTSVITMFGGKKFEIVDKYGHQVHPPNHFFFSKKNKTINGLVVKEELVNKMRDMNIEIHDGHLKVEKPNGKKKKRLVVTNRDGKNTSVYSLVTNRNKKTLFVHAYDVKTFNGTFGLRTSDVIDGRTLKIKPSYVTNWEFPNVAYQVSCFVEYLVSTPDEWSSRNGDYFKKTKKEISRFMDDLNKRRMYNKSWWTRGDEKVLLDESKMSLPSSSFSI